MVSVIRLETLEEARRTHGTVVTSLAFPELVGTNLLHGSVVLGLVVLDGNLSAHSSNGSNTSLVASLDEESDVGIHERNGHRDVAAVGENKVGVESHLLDEREDVWSGMGINSGRNKKK